MARKAPTRVLPALKRHFVVTGMGHSATMWLAQALNLWPRAVVAHEAFDVEHPKWPEELRIWAETNSPVVGTVNPQAVFLFGAVEFAVRPRWAFVWRDPLVTLHRDAETTHPAPGQLHYWPLLVEMRARIVYGAIERTLKNIEALGRPVSHWAYEYYTTREGLAALADWLRLGPMPDNLTLPAPANVSRRDAHPIPEPHLWNSETKQRVLRILRGLPLCWQTIQNMRRCNCWVMRDG